MRARWFLTGYLAGVGAMVAALVGAYGYFTGTPKRNVDPEGAAQEHPDGEWTVCG